MLTLDQHWQDPFWQSPYRLRFQLNTGGRYVNMFTSAYLRARELARAALAIERPLAIVAAFASPYWKVTAEQREGTHRSGFDLLKDMGVSTDKPEASWRGAFNQPD